MIFNIQRFSTHDGQGIRTMIFFKGCPLHCLWCCNPESQSFGYSLMYDRRLCKNFRDCLLPGGKGITSGTTGINIEPSEIQHPEKFRNVCASRALTVSGEEKSVDDILTEIEKDMPFYLESEGGITLSGGEPLSQGAELKTLLMEIKRRNINISIETSLHVPWGMIIRCLDFTDTFLVDLKHTDNGKFKSYTGGKADLVLTNIQKLALRHKNVIIRVPVIPDFNHSEQEMKKIIDFTVSLKTVREIHLLPFHTLGALKYNMLGMEYTYKGKRKVDNCELTGYKEYAEQMGLIAKTGG